MIIVKTKEKNDFTTYVRIEGKEIFGLKYGL